MSKYQYVSKKERIISLSIEAAKYVDEEFILVNGKYYSKMAEMPKWNAAFGNEVEINVSINSGKFVWAYVEGE